MCVAVCGILIIVIFGGRAWRFLLCLFAFFGVFVCLMGRLCFCLFLCLYIGPFVFVCWGVCWGGVFVFVCFIVSLLVS